MPTISTIGTVQLGSIRYNPWQSGEKRRMQARYFE